LKLEEIQELWNRDREIDYTELGTESIRIPQIHDKYLKIYTDERIKLRGLEFELSKLVRAKTDWYAGRMSQARTRAHRFGHRRCNAPGNRRQYSRRANCRQVRQDQSR